VTLPGVAHPEWTAAVAAALALAAAGLAAARHRARRRARVLLGPGADRIPGAAGDAALWLGLALAGVALLGPLLGERRVWRSVSGVDVVVLLDVSASMLASDAPPSRLDRARETARRALVALGPGDRAALAAFAGRGVLLTPLTHDHAALVELLPALDPDLLQEGGSRTGAGLRAALEAFEAESARPRVLLLLGDGEDPERSELPLAALSRAGVRVVAAAFGSEAGAPVPEGTGWLRDAAGETVISRRAREPLLRLSEATGGELLVADRFGAIDDARAVAALRRDAGSAPGERALRRVPRDWSAALAAAALLVLGLELAAPGRPTRRAAALGAPAVVLALASALASNAPGALDALEARVRARPDDARALLELGLARADAGDPDEAARALFAAAARARDRGLAALACFDLGVVELSRGRLEAARDAFYDALAFDASDREARFNLEWTLRALGAKPPPAAGAGRDEAAPPSDAPVPTPDPGGRGPDEADPSPASPAAQPEPRPHAEGSPAARSPTALAPEAVERWLERVTDDPHRSLRSAAERAQPDEARSSRAPRW
jgi:Ca-activated chloride channel family protein